MTDPQTDPDEYDRYFAPRQAELSEADQRLYEQFFPDATTTTTTTEETR